MLDLVKQSILISFKNWKIVSTVYIIQLFFSLIFGVQIYKILNQSIGNSLTINELVNHFDYTVLMDIFHSNKKQIIDLIKNSSDLILLWLIVSVYLNAGLIQFAAINNERFGIHFFRRANKYFIPFLKMALLFWTLSLIWTGITLMPILINLESMLGHFNSEKYVLFFLLISVLIWFSGCLFLFNWSVGSRTMYITHSGSINSAIKNALRSIWKNKFTVFIFLIIVLFLQSLMVFIYKLCDSQMNSSSWILVSLGIVIQQLFIFNKIQFRLMLYAGIRKILL